MSVARVHRCGNGSWTPGKPNVVCEKIGTYVGKYPFQGPTCGRAQILVPISDDIGLLGLWSWAPTR
eukprot:6033727-Karenia_brevis.AAC.1